MAPAECPPVRGVAPWASATIRLEESRGAWPGNPGTVQQRQGPGLRGPGEGRARSRRRRTVVKQHAANQRSDAGAGTTVSDVPTYDAGTGTACRLLMLGNNHTSGCEALGTQSKPTTPGMGGAVQSNSRIGNPCDMPHGGRINDGL